MNILSIDEAKKFARGQKVVIITGVTGQDGSFMSDYLLKNTPYTVFGGARRLSVANHENVDHLKDEERFHLINFDLTDAHSISQIISQIQPDYFINFAAQSFVKSSWDFPAQTWDSNTKSIIHILESLRLHAPKCRFYNAGSSEEFGNVEYSPQDEKHPARPRSPYGASKSGARDIVKVYRESYNMYAIQGWLFNHEGTRRGEEFVTRKITKNVVRIANAIKCGGVFDPLELGNIDVHRDWSDAEDCVDAVWRMLNQEQHNSSLTPLLHSWYQSRFSGPVKDKDYVELCKWLSKEIKEYVVSSGEGHTVREFVEKSFEQFDIKGMWVGENVGETYMYNALEPRCLVRINPAFYRPADVDNLLGNSSLIRSELGWNPKTTFSGLVEKMVKADLARLK